MLKVQAQVAGSGLSIAFCSLHRMLKSQAQVTRSGLPFYLATPMIGVGAAAPSSRFVAPRRVEGARRKAGLKGRGLELYLLRWL